MVQNNRQKKKQANREALGKWLLCLVEQAQIHTFCEEEVSRQITASA